jgi:uncharacterized membrane protein
MPATDKGLENAMGHMLRIGVTVAALVVLAGGVLQFVQFAGSIPDYRHFHGAPPTFEHVTTIVAGIGGFDGNSVVLFGILLLIATPICRVIFGVVGFSLMKDKVYAPVSAIVLIVLLLSCFARR